MATPMLEDGSPSTLIEALIATADARLWERYCRLAAELTAGTAAAQPTFAVGSVEWQRTRNQPSARRSGALGTAEEAAGRQRLVQRGAPPPFAGVPSPLGAGGGAAFDEFVSSSLGPPALLAEIEMLEHELVGAFEQAGRSGRYRAAGFCDAARTEIDPHWFGRVRLDFAHNRVTLPDGSVIAGIVVTPAAGASPCPAPRTGTPDRPARAMLRETLVALWERGAFTSGTGNERVLALVLNELHLPPANPPYGFKSAETVRKLRKTLGMSL